MIFLDMDGVIANFDSAAEKLLNRPITDVPKKEFWKTIDAAGWQYWADIEPYFYTKELWNRLNEIDDTYICSSPSIRGDSLKGKLIWLQKHLKTDKFVFTKHKWLLANKYNLLVDDKLKKTMPFAQNGGKVWLWEPPSAWYEFNNILKDIERTYNSK